MAERGIRSMQDAVYHEIRKGIMTLKLVPGEAMSTQEMADRLNVSRTPVREAFIHLQRENLVEMIPQRETVVSRIDLHRVEQERFVRESLEVSVIGQAVENFDETIFRQMQDNFNEQLLSAREKNAVHFVYLDDLFHRMIFAMAGAALAGEIVAAYNGHYGRVRVLTVSTEQRIKNLEGSLEQHRQILEHLASRNKEGLIHLLTDHLRRINYEKSTLLADYPDYFVAEGRQNLTYAIKKL